MSRRHIAIFAMPAPPHINPTLSVVSALVQRGHRLTYLTSDLFSQAVSAVGAEPVLCQRLFEAPTDTSAPESDSAWMSWDEMGRGYPYFIDWAARILPGALDSYDNDRPDLILCDSHFYAGRILAARWGIPVIQISPIFAFHDAYYPRKNGVCYTPKGFMEFNGQLDEFFRKNGVAATNSLFHKEALNIYFFPRAFQFDADSFDHRFFFAGGCIAERPPEGEWTARRPEDGPVILVSASTTYYYGPQYFSMIIEALQGLPWRVIIATGERVDLSEIGELPEGIEVHRYVSYPRVLPHCWLNVCHGGTSTIVESMYHGVAMICVSCSDEPAEYSTRVSELGLGVHVRKHQLTAPELRRIVLAMANDRQMLDGVKQMQHTVRQERGWANDVADQVVDYLAATVAHE